MFALEMQIEITMSWDAVQAFPMANCLSLPILLSIFGPMVHILEKEVKNCRNSMLLGLLHVTSYVETENNLFLSCPAITDTKYSPRGFPQ